MAERWSNVNFFLATEVPGEPSGGIFVYYDTASDWSEISGIVVKGGVEVCPRLDVRVESGLLEEIEGEFGLFEEEAPEVFWEGFVNAC